MKKLPLVLACIFGMSLSGFASNSEKPGKDLLKKKKGAVVKNDQSLLLRQCFAVTLYLDCGRIWDGDVCVNTNANSLSQTQFQTAWNLANYAYCGPNVIPWI